VNAPTDSAALGGSAIIVFDGSCVLCSRWTRFVLRFDRQAYFHLAAMQSEAGRQILLQHGLDPDDPASFLVVEGHQSWRDSAALLKVLRHCGWFWRGVSGVARLCPGFLRDAAYRMIARNRYRWFGQQAVCLLPDPKQAERFIR
jgi:predicted DCC family thiol-disulfide oxidoreductase YuxK